MRRFRIAKVCMAIGLVLGLMVMPMSQLEVQAKETIATVQGTILTGTTSDLLLLSTKDGKMEIKLDSDTDASGAKILLPDTKIYVSLSHESDGYLHAVKITSDTQSSTVTLDSSSTATVTGTIGEKTKGDILYFNTAQGEMQIKLDTTTNMSGCNVLVAGKNYVITCVRGTDAYMHATSIADSTSTTTYTSTASTSTASVAPAGVATTSVSGTVTKSTTKDILYLSTKDGEMQFKIDSNADTGKGMVLVPDRKMTVAFYHGSDAYLHAVSIVGEQESFEAATVDSSSNATVTGTVNSKSTQNVLYLDTKDGLMELKLDKVNSLTNCKVLIKDMKLSVTCQYGSDAYMHAIDIAAK